MPLGTEISSDGVNFSVFSRNGTKVSILFYHEESDCEPFSAVEFDPELNRTGDVWHIFVKGVKAGDLYLYQVDGPFEPLEGHRFNGKQLLFDPCAKAITDESVFANIPSGYVVPVDKIDIDLFDRTLVEKFPKCVVVDDSSFDWEGDKPINRPLKDSIIYETHLKGFTANSNSGVEHPGTYLGFSEKIPYLQQLGITAVEFLPLYEFDGNENCNINPRTGEKLKNYWGYSTVNFYSPKASFAYDKKPGACVTEFKILVKNMHRAGIEVILDVVFNHTAEGNEHGIALNFRGFDNAVYYQLVPTHKEYYLNFSGCGNSFNANNPVVSDYIVECLRYWVLSYHIDGFRFDLAPVLNRLDDGYLQKVSPLIRRIAEDPVLHDTKMIAEPWDAGGAYQLGEFPGTRWGEWNDHFRDDIRCFWRGDEFCSTKAATRISGSSDLFGFRKPWVSINYVCCHDGFTMNDLISYNSKHNEENGEDNRDGSDNNYSYNSGYEGPTANPLIERTRNRQMKNFILTTLISQGTPMLLGGDEFRRSQKGNNNAYCQDSELSWFDWSCADANKEILEFTRRAIALRKAHGVFRRSDFFAGTSNGSSDIQWYSEQGRNPDWGEISRFLAFMLSGKDCTDSDGNCDDDFFVAANTDYHDAMVKLPTLVNGRQWFRVADTSVESEDAILDPSHYEQLVSQGRYTVPAGSMIILVAKKI